MKKYILLFAIVGILATACDEEYLELYPTTAISENASFLHPGECECGDVRIV